MQSIQSRLKSRKILGVGEAADGQLHRSKISQILGNDSLTNTRIDRAACPIGLQALQWTSCLWFSAIGLASIFSPRSILPAEMTKGQELTEGDPSYNQQLDLLRASLVAGTRMYGASMLALAALCLVVSLANWQSKRAIRIVLLVQGIFYVAELLASILATADGGHPIPQPAVLNIMRIIVSLASFYYFKQMGPNTVVVTKKTPE